MDKRYFPASLRILEGHPTLTATRAPLLVCIFVLSYVIWGLDSPHKECIIHFTRWTYRKKDPSGISPTSILRAQTSGSFYTKHLGFQQYQFAIFKDSELNITESILHCHQTIFIYLGYLWTKRIALSLLIVCVIMYHNTGWNVLLIQHALCREYYSIKCSLEIHNFATFVVLRCVIYGESLILVVNTVQVCRACCFTMATKQTPTC